MAKLYNLARMTTATTGTGPITLGVAVSGYLSFAATGVANGDVVDYAIKDGANSEHGTGTYAASGTTLTRTPTKSTNSNAAINLSGTAEVFISPRAETLNDGSLLTTGTVADARLSSNVPLKNGVNTFSSVNTFNQNVTVGAGTFTVNNSGGASGGIQCNQVGIFNYATANTGAYQFTTNFGAGQTIINPSATGAPFWFVSSDSGSAGFSLHRGGAYAINVGLSANNYFYIGGWSDVAGVFRLAVGPGGDAYLPNSLQVASIPNYGVGGVGAKNTAKALVQFTASTGAILDSYNVSSVTRNGVGDYTLNFATALPSSNYAVAGSLKAFGSNGWMQVVNGAQSASTLRVQACSQAPALFDPADASIVVFDAG